jgi:hypothetical protein
LPSSMLRVLGTFSVPRASVFVISTPCVGGGVVMRGPGVDDMIVDVALRGIRGLVDVDYA